MPVPPPVLSVASHESRCRGATRLVSLALFPILLLALPLRAAPPAAGSVVTERFISAALRDNKVGLNPARSVSVYLPPGYASSGGDYPVIYFFHGIGGSNEGLFAPGTSAAELFDRAIARGTIAPFILVAPDYRSPTLGSWFENSSTSGRWLDYTFDEVIPQVERRFRVIRHRDSRAVAGEFTGGYGALKLAMLQPDRFSVVYALHPVGTGTGLTPMYTHVDWKRLHAATRFEDLWKIDTYSPGFVAMAQAYLPNPDRPPFYCDHIVELENGEPVLQPAQLDRLQSQFLLDRLLPRHADNLRRLRAIAFDWGRYDRTQTHVYSNQAFTRALDNLGIEHTAEEYNGNQYEKNWIRNGRVETRMLPFIGQWLASAPPPEAARESEGQRGPR